MKAMEGLQQRIRDVRGGSRMFGDIRRSSEKFLWTARAELWMARAAVVEACPAGEVLSQFIWFSTPTVRQHAATSRRCVLMMPQRALANDGLKCFWCVCLMLCAGVFLYFVLLFRGRRVGLPSSTRSSVPTPCAIRSGSRQLHCASLSWRRLHRPRSPCHSRSSANSVPQ